MDLRPLIQVLNPTDAPISLSQFVQFAVLTHLRMSQL